jgi:predicted metal-dependent enzyme (double-stranded beta helix superfamily)
VGEDELGPIGTRLMVSNDLVNIWEVALAPGELQPWHRHRYPYVVVVLEDSRSEITDQYGQVHAPGSGRGTVVFDPGGAVHKLQNIGGARLRDRLIEFKVPLNPALLREIAK